MYSKKTPAVLLRAVRRQSALQPATQTRLYAQPAPGPPRSPSHTDEALLTWPVPVHPHETPTPYQILAHGRGDVYSKHRFYSLAKLYHPDSCSHASSPVAHVPNAVCLERYRLLVTAHGILSDDTKRRAYDMWGSGWKNAHGHHRPAAASWSADNSPMHNATWEDWERWRERESGERTGDSRVVYMNNFAFITLVFALVSLGGVVQATRANTLSSSASEHRDQLHREASIELARAKQSTMYYGDRKERVRRFLEHREANLAGEPYQRLLPPTDTSAAETTRKQ